MRAIVHSLAAENGSLRGLTGQGEPGLWTLLGGTGQELDATGYRIGGGPGQVSGASRLSRVRGETLVAAVSSGTLVPGVIRPDPLNPAPPIPERPR